MSQEKIKSDRILFFLGILAVATSCSSPSEEFTGQWEKEGGIGAHCYELITIRSDSMFFHGTRPMDGQPLEVSLTAEYKRVGNEATEVVLSYASGTEPKNNRTSFFYVEKWSESASRGSLYLKKNGHLLDVSVKSKEQDGPVCHYRAG